LSAINARVEFDNVYHQPNSAAAIDYS